MGIIDVGDIEEGYEREAELELKRQWQRQQSVVVEIAPVGNIERRTRAGLRKHAVPESDGKGAAVYFGHVRPFRRAGAEEEEAGLARILAQPVR